MKVYFVFVLFALLFGNISSSLAQEANFNGILFQNEQVTVQSSTMDCISEVNGTAKQFVSVEIENKTEGQLLISFKKDMWYAGKCISCNSNSDEYITSITIEPNESVKGNCETPDKQLKVFVKMLNLTGVRTLTHFELVDMNITEP